ncbi:MAG: hypothetical protein WC150_00900 [Bacteroidia bacterium]
MKKLLYVFIGIAIALGAVVLYSFKAKENAEVSYAIIEANIDQISIFYDDGQEEVAEKLLGIKVGQNLDKGQLPFENALSKTLKHMSQKGYKVVGYSGVVQNGPARHYYTLIKEN